MFEEQSRMRATSARAREKRDTQRSEAESTVVSGVRGQATGCVAGCEESTLCLPLSAPPAKRKLLCGVRVMMAAVLLLLLLHPAWRREPAVARLRGSTEAV